MLICDLIIISFEKRIPFRHLRDRFTFEKYNRNGFLPPKLYKDAFPVLQAFRGFWYRVYPPAKDMYTNTFFDMEIGADGIPYVVVRKEWINNISRLMTHFLGFEPGLHFGVLVRLDGTRNEVIHTGYTIAKFVDELLQGNIRFDELYVIG